MVGIKIDKRTPSVSTGRSYKCSLPGNRALLRLSDKSLAAIQISTFTFWKKVIKNNESS